MPPRPEPVLKEEDEPPTTQEQLNALIQLANHSNNRFDLLLAILTTQSARMATQHETLNTITTLLTTLTHHIRQEPPHPPPPPPPPPPRHQEHPRPPKITLPLFTGDNPLDWIFQANNYFEYYAIPEDQRIALSVFYFTGNALSWYKHQATNQLLGNWAEFSRAIELRFGPSTFENHQAALFKLSQTSTITAYQSEFEKISNRVNGLTPDALLNCFLSGLRTDIRNELAILHPTSLNQAYGLAKLVEDKFNAIKPKYPFHRSYSAPSSSTSGNPTPITTGTNTNPPQLPSASKAILPTPPNPQTNLPFTRLTPEALQKRRREGLCFKCPEKFTPGHKCNPPQFFLVVDNEDHEPEIVLEPPSPTTIETIDHQYFALSTAAFFGISSPQALRVTGFINQQPVTILVDSGSTHNIIQPRWVSFFKLPRNSIPEFPVLVGNGDTIKCSGFCPNLALTLDNHEFTIPSFVLPVEGADIILGLAWLATLGPTLADFSVPQLTFTRIPSTA
ncbi:hypothetical protein LXL04_002923 [Taraxacum kok-saghyz]